MILAGDVGGTKTALGLYRPGPAGPDLVEAATFPSREAPSLEAIIAGFLDARGRPAIEVACVGVAGAVVEGRTAVTNLTWTIDERSLAAAIPARRVRLLNDLEAAAHGVLALPPAAFHVLQAGVERAGPVALIAAGTGLGEAFVVRAGERPVVVATEGGHADFAPRGELQEDLLRYLRKAFGRASYERVLSGPGLHNVYRFLRDTGVAPESPAVAARIADDDPGAVITEQALAGADRLCALALDVLVSVYGAEAGNLALRTLALGGVVLGGGIAPRILPRLAAGSFLTAFRDKGRLAPLMETIPVRVALDPSAPLLGAATVAYAALRNSPG
ncbi:MAG TPA: glucokinase [Candidatus Tectomicrobia bacterium]|nr:glucokinase [Candidatus Tectomicrobia bacterium]